MKNLKTVSTEPHEIVIEVNEEVEYLKKRLTKLKAEDLLNSDNDYLNAIYKILPHNHQLDWDKFDITNYETEWKAFAVFLENIYASALRKRTRMESLNVMEGKKNRAKEKCRSEMFNLFRQRAKKQRMSK